jgi:AcrR family transcriptional regulator
MSEFMNIRKRQIITSALEIISEEGVKNLTMKKIANRIGISDAALYRHFKNKQELMLVMIETVGMNLVTKISLSGSNVDNPVDRLEEILHNHLTYLEKNKGIPRLIFSETVHQNDPILRNSVLKIVNQYLDLIRGILLQAKETGQVKENIDIEATAMAFLGLVQATALLWSLNGFRFAVSEKAPILWRVISKMLN